MSLERPALFERKEKVEPVKQSWLLANQFAEPEEEVILGSISNRRRLPARSEPNLPLVSRTLVVFDQKRTRDNDKGVDQRFSDIGK